MLVKEPKENYAGWIKIYRSIKHHWVWESPIYLKMWLYCLIRANHEEKKTLFDGNLVSLTRGEFITSTTNFAKDCRCGRQQVRRFLKLSKLDSMLITKATNKATHITICNYDSYQNSQPTNNQQKTNRKPTENQQKTTDKNYKNVKNVKNICLYPEFSEFSEYAKTLRIYHTSLDYQIEAKYNAWREDGWKDGNGKPIKNWKTKLQNTIPYFKRSFEKPAEVKSYKPSDIMQEILNG